MCCLLEKWKVRLLGNVKNKLTNWQTFPIIHICLSSIRKMWNLWIEVSSLGLSRWRPQIWLRELWYVVEKFRYYLFYYCPTSFCFPEIKVIEFKLPNVWRSWLHLYVAAGSKIGKSGLLSIDTKTEMDWSECFNNSFSLLLTSK